MNVTIYFRRLASDADRKVVDNPKAKLWTVDTKGLESDDPAEVEATLEEMKKAVVLEARPTDKAQDGVLQLHTNRSEIDAKLYAALRKVDLMDHFIPQILKAGSVGYYHVNEYDKESGEVVRQMSGTRVYYPTPNAPFIPARGVVVTDADVTPEDRQTGIAA